MTVVCCSCKKVRVEGEWKRSHDHPGEPESHTYCPVCLDAAKADLIPVSRPHRTLSPAAVPMFTTVV